MWQVFENGELPYSDISNLNELLEAIRKGLRLKQPSSCPSDIFNLMNKSWYWVPEKRPSLRNIETILDPYYEVIFEIFLRAFNMNLIFFLLKLSICYEKLKAFIDNLDLYDNVSYKTIECSDDVKASVAALCDFLNKTSFIKEELPQDLIDVGVRDDLHPILLKYYQPHKTTGDGNCLYNMISISIIGNESLNQILRALTFFTLCILKESFIQILQTNYYTQEKALLEFNNLLFDAKTLKNWGDKYHLLALSTFLSTEIVIYGSFRSERTGNLKVQAQTDNILQDKFINDVKIGNHYLFKPVQNQIFHSSREVPLFGHFSMNNKHYTSLISNKLKNPIFKPPQSYLEINTTKF